MGNRPMRRLCLGGAAVRNLFHSAERIATDKSLPKLARELSAMHGEEGENARSVHSPFHRQHRIRGFKYWLDKSPRRYCGMPSLATTE